MRNNIKRVLVIEDNKEVWDMLGGLFKDDASYKFTFVGNGDEGSELLNGGNFDLAIVDLELPGKYGRQIVIDARAAGVKTPILVLTANKSEYSEYGNIDDGANDYVTKPCVHKVLISRIHRLIRDSVTTPDPIIRFRGFTFDTFRDTVSGDGFKPFDIPNIPARILEVLLRSRVQLVEFATLLREVWGTEDRVGLRTLNRNANRINEAFEENGLPKIVNLVKGRGYELVRG